MNTKQDFINMKNTPKGKRLLKALIDNRFYWKDICVTNNPIIDDTHRIIEDEDGFLIQQEYVENPNCELFLLGFTVEEANELIGG